jgi:hypothetical protein
VSHVRTQIRAAFLSALEAQLSADYDLFASRKYKLNMVDRPMLDMRFSSVDITAQTMGDLRTHTGALFIRVQRMATGDDIDDLLDQDEVNVTAAIEAVDWSNLLEQDPELTNVMWADGAEGDVPVGMIVLRYDVEYRVAKNDPETMRF